MNNRQAEKIKEIEVLLHELKATAGEQSATSSMNPPLMRKTSGVLWIIWKKRVLLFFTSMILILGGLGAGIIYWFSGSNTVTETGSFIEEIQELHSLATAQAFVKAVIEEENNELFGQEISADFPGTKRKVLLVVPGSVLAGVDLTQIQDQDVKIDEAKKVIEITLPHAELLQDVSIDTEKIQTYSVEGVFRNEVDWEEGFELASEAKKIIEEEAIAQGVLVAAEKNAEKSLTQFFQRLDYTVKTSFEVE
ncbi:DUF4230 domain-containing protein [Bacillus sp. 2205SS5-2]|uniref:DUF4230 domain-containing protein n=1 Tax=Bacillus sp. 2205SS5-2 TaxID=3109031 RepID=UPI003004147B